MTTTNEAPNAFADKALQLGTVALVARAKTLKIEREAFLGAVAAAWDVFEKHEPTLRKWMGFWDAIKAEAKTQREGEP